MQLIAAGGLDPNAAALAAVLVVAGLVAVVAQRFKIAAIPAYIVTGAVLGPTAGGMISSAGAFQSVSEIAVILLMFGIGMHLDLGTFRRSAKQLIGVGAASTILSVLLLWPVALVLGLSTQAALIIAMALSLSSTATVLRLMQLQRTIGEMTGRLSVGILIMQDILVIPMLMVIPLLATGEGKDAGPSTDLWMGLLAVVGILVVGRFVMPKLLSVAAKGGAGSDEVMMILGLGFGIGAATVTGVAGFSPALGAFLAGLLLSTSVFSSSLEGQVGTLRDVFLAVFFTSVGMALNLAQVWAGIDTVLLGVVAVLVCKSLSIGLTAWAGGATGPLAGRATLGLAGGGEFGLVLLTTALGVGVVTEAMVSEWSAVIVITMVMTPPMMAQSSRVARALAKIGPPRWTGAAKVQEGEEAPHYACAGKHVVIAGYGYVGRAVAERLTPKGYSTAVIELNLRTVKRQTALGRWFVYGDASDQSVLESAKIEHAQAMVLTIPDEEAVLRAVSAARRMAPDLLIVVRSTYMSRAFRAVAEGASVTVIEELVTGNAMADVVEKGLSNLPKREAD